jgi:hypothetical protein
MRIILCLMMHFGQSLTPTCVKADLPQALKPGAPGAFWCTDRAGAEEVATAFDQNADCHSQLKKEGSGGIDALTVVIAVITAALGGYFIGKSER